MCCILDIEEIITPMDVDNEQTSEYQGLKRFWSFIKSRRKDYTGVASLKKNGLTKESPEGRATILNEQFESVFTREPDIPHDLLPKNFPHPVMDNISITESGVLKMLQRLKPHKAMGPDHISARVLKELAPIYSTHLDRDLSQILCHRKGARRLD